LNPLQFRRCSCVMSGMTRGDTQIAVIAAGQGGAFTRLQANDAGLSDDQLARRVRAGTLLQTGPHSFRVAGAPRTLRTELTDVVLGIGDPVLFAGPTAAALLGFDGFELRRPFHVLLPRRRHVTRNHVRVHRTDAFELVDRATVDDLPVTTAARTIIDLARTISASRLAACIDSAVRDGRVSEDLLHRRIVALRSQGRYGLPTLAEVLAGYEVTRGGHSWLEREYLCLVAAAGLPRPDTQQVLSRAGDRMVRVDCHFPGTCVVVELLGYRFHRTRAQMESDATRANALMRDGYRPYQFTYGQIVAESRYVIATTRGALRAAA
jgi:hypothetical protein